MKRNMVPLLGIAFVVAIISTGVFYGLFAGKLRSSSELPAHTIVVAARDLDRGTVVQASDLRASQVPGAVAGTFSSPEQAAGGTLLAAVKADEPLLEERVSGRGSEHGSGGEIPSGMRAVTLHVYQSETLLNMLRPGSKVDLQAVSDRNGPAELRTVLENVQVLGVSPADANGNRPAGAAVTVLVGARDSDMVALADAGSRIRVALRNPLDGETSSHHPVALGSLFASGFKAERGGGPEPNLHASSSVWDHPVQMRVRVLSVSDAAAEALRSHSNEVVSGSRSNTPHSNTTQSNAGWRVAAFHSGDEPEKLIRKLERTHELEVVDRERLMAGIGRPISYHAGINPDQLRVRFSPVMADGKVGLRVEPRMGSSVATEAQLPNASSFLVEGTAQDPTTANALAKMFPGRSWERKHVVLVVSTRAIQQNSGVVAARTDRER